MRCWLRSTDQLLAVLLGGGLLAQHFGACLVHGKVDKPPTTTKCFLLTWLQSMSLFCTTQQAFPPKGEHLKDVHVCYPKAVLYVGQVVAAAASCSKGNCNTLQAHDPVFSMIERLGQDRLDRPQAGRVGQGRQDMERQAG